MKIGLSLSGGGFRATVFHLGVLARLAEEGLMEEVTCVSTVSGGQPLRQPGLCSEWASLAVQRRSHLPGDPSSSGTADDAGLAAGFDRTSAAPACSLAPYQS